MYALPLVVVLVFPVLIAAYTYVRLELASRATLARIEASAPGAPIALGPDPSIAASVVFLFPITAPFVLGRGCGLRGALEGTALVLFLPSVMLLVLAIALVLARLAVHGAV